MAQPGISGWQAQILHGIGAPVTQQNLLFVNDWAKAEGGGASNNPFNTTEPAAGASSYNSVGVRNYGSPQQGIKATIQTLQNGRYGNIIGALRQGTNAKSAASALAASPWGTGSLVEKMLGGGAPVSAAVPNVPARTPMSVGAPNPSSSAPTGNLLGQLIGQTNEMVGLGSSPTLANLLTGSPTQKPPPASSRGLASASGTVKFLGDTGGEKPGFLSSLAQAVRAVGGSQVKVNSGYRSPTRNAQVGGVPDSNHTTGDAMDGSVFVNGRWLPLGVALKPVARRYGLRSGAVAGFFNGRPDPVHVDDGRNQR